MIFPGILNGNTVRTGPGAGILLSGQWAGDRQSMSRDAEGNWSVTLDYIKPGIYEYSFVVDGVRMIDPGNPAIKPMREPRTSILHLPAARIDGQGLMGLS